MHMKLLSMESHTIQLSNSRAAIFQNETFVWPELFVLGNTLKQRYKSDFFFFFYQGPGLTSWDFLCLLPIYSKQQETKGSIKQL